jgi:uncharacterized membrane protein YczE
VDNIGKQRLIKRIVFSSCGLIIMVLGIAMYIKANIGAPCGDVIPVAVSHFTPLTVGQCAVLFHVLCIIMQVLVTRRPQIKHVLQLPLAFAFGILMDVFLNLLDFELVNIFYRVALLLAGIIIFSFGIRVIVGSNLLLLPPDGLAREIGGILGGAMSKGKLVFDIAVTLIAILITLLLAGNAFLVVNIGTLICAVGTGPLIGLYMKLFPFLDLNNKPNS